VSEGVDGLDWKAIKCRLISFLSCMHIPGVGRSVFAGRGLEETFGTLLTFLELARSECACKKIILLTQDTIG